MPQIRRRVLLVLALLALPLFPARLLAAPGELTSTGPFGVMDLGVRDLVFPAADPQRILIQTRKNLFESRDGGASWRSVLDNAPQIGAGQLVVDPADPQRWYLAESGYGARIWQTTDAGRSWSAWSWPLEDPDDYRRIRLFVDARDGRKMAVEIDSSALEGTYRYLSQDRGATFAELAPDWDHFAQLLLGIHDGSVYARGIRLDLVSGVETPVATYPDTSLYFDRADRNTLYQFRNEVLYRSSDRGATLQALRHVGPSPRFFVQSPANPAQMAVASLRGLFVTPDGGASWTNDENVSARDGAFDPATGELLLASQTLLRRRPDGSYTAPSPLVGLDASAIREVAAAGERALAVGFLGTTYFRDGEGLWEQRGDIRDGASALHWCVNQETHVLFSPEAAGLAVAACEQGIFTTSDAGWTWKISPSGPRAGFGPYQLAASESTLYFLGDGRIDCSADFGLSWELLAGSDFSGLAAHPQQGLLAVKNDGGLFRYRPATGWQSAGASLPGNAAVTDYQPYIVSEPAHPNLVYGIRGSLLSRSLDFGASWQVVADLDAASTYADLHSWRYIYYPYLKLRIDPFDADHLLLLVLGLESRDGGRTFSYAENVAYGIATFDRLTPGRLLVAGDAQNGVLERTASLPACTDSGRAWCAAGGRYLLTVDWKTFSGLTGRAIRVTTGSEDSGLFYFFDPGNWELLVKVLDGCSINGRQWLFAAGTTDVEYRLRVEDRWTGQIRNYYNAPGEPAPAITDTDAFAGCAATPPPGAAPAALEPAIAGEGGETRLPLVGGRFTASALWTNFSGQEGDARTAPLRSDNSGLFYFFSPDNWEMLVKVLDGCALNGHYWVLAAATTDVGYRLEIADAHGGAPKVYANPVGRASPAQIDTAAFPCR